MQLANKRVRIIFEDSGRGMSSERVEQLFEPFSSSTTGGTGLGLSIVYQIVKDHSATINVRSAEGKGTTITIELPMESRKSIIRPIAGVHDTAAPTRLKEFLKVQPSEIRDGR
jgi:signal transduction histidine kinase